MMCHSSCESTWRESTETLDMHLLISWRRCFVMQMCQMMQFSALKHFRCDACDRLKQPPSKRKVAVNHAETFNDIVSMDVNFWKITFMESPRVKTTVKVLNIVDAASGMHIAIQIAGQSAETIWRAFATGWLRWTGSPRCLRVDPHRSQIARGFFDKAEGRGIFVEPTPAEAHWQMGQMENNARYLRQMGYRIVEDIDVSQSDFQTMLDELTDAKNSLVQHNGYMPRQSVFGLIPRVPGLLLAVKRTLTYPIWILRVVSGGLPRCATSVEWRRSRLRRMRKSERV